MINDYITIGELNHYIKEKFDEDIFLRKVHIKGEISNFKAHTRGHYYFTLKDDTSRISAIMFSFNTRSLKFVPTDGMKVLVTGKISVYEANGNYQIPLAPPPSSTSPYSFVRSSLGSITFSFSSQRFFLSQGGCAQFSRAAAPSISFSFITDQTTCSRHAILPSPLP